MATLHLVSGTTHSALETCLRVCAEQDALLFLQGATYSLQHGSASSALLGARTPDIALFALAQHIEARRIVTDPELRIRLVDWPDVVQLTEQYARSATWR